MYTRVRYKSFDQLSFIDLLVYSKLPPHPFWSYLEPKVDFTFADRLCAVLYSGRGQRPYPPSLKLKVHLLQAYENLSYRGTELHIVGDLFFKRFSGVPVDFIGFDHSTIGKDRARLGPAMFQACHLYILAQLYSLGLWGDRNEQWIIDSFPCQIGVVMVGAYRLIQQAMLRILQQLKRSYPSLYQLTTKSLELESVTRRLSAQSTDKDQMLAFSKLAAEAYALLNWFDHEDIVPLMQSWKNPKARQKSLELQALLEQILIETCRPVDPDSQPDLDEGSEVAHGSPEPPSLEASSSHSPEPEAASHPDPDEGSEGVHSSLEPPSLESPFSHSPEPEASHPIDAIAYEKIPRKDRPAHRIISAHAPEARLGAKSRFVMTKGFKVQNLCSTRSVILDTRVIPASEPDRVAMVDMVRGIQSFFHVTPRTLLGDTAYGYGKERLALAALGIEVVAPVATRNPTGLYDISRFTYNREKNVYTCPNGKETVRFYDKPQIEGFQFEFSKKDCQECPLKMECTTSKDGKRVFHSYYYDTYEAAKAYNASDEGKAAHKLRYLVERKNKELKNDCGLGRSHSRERDTIQIKSTVSAIVVNLKLMVRQLIAPRPGFNRRAKQA
ncbi:transposase [Paenibacillus koleovorans]|uniref:transposase n=1 Tax=Paenibacillus koleovorans TaxID=121608 RepID=UPI000FD8B186|nr:transposase [Paenibacillus koleovorans]